MKKIIILTIILLSTNNSFAYYNKDNSNSYQDFMDQGKRESDQRSRDLNNANRYERILNNYDNY